MKRNFNLALLLPVIILLSGCAPWLRGGADRTDLLRRSVEDHLRSIYFKGASWSIMAVDLESGRILLDHDADRSLVPASNLKLLITACALETLSPDYRLETRIGYTGEVDSSGVLRGDLVIIGSGDPTIATRFQERPTAPYGDTPPDPLLAWADSLAAKGIQHIEGDLVGYGAFISNERYGPGWEWDDLKRWYAAEISPLIYTDNCIEITITPADSAGEYARISWDPALNYADFYGQVLTTDPELEPMIKFDRGLANNVITIWGTVPAGSSPIKRWVAVYDAQNWFLTALKDALSRRGITIAGNLRATRSAWIERGDFHLLFTHRSAPLSTLITAVNRDSRNLYAESLIRAMGALAIENDTTGIFQGMDAFQAGRAVVKMWESQLVGSSTGYVLTDGCGLARRNLMSANSIIKVLVNMNRSPYRADFISSLATPGAGTLKYRFFALPDGVYLHAKSGSLTRVRALSGYLAMEEGPRIAFAMICNNYLCEDAEVEAAMENICQLLALHLKSGR